MLCSCFHIRFIIENGAPSLCHTQTGPTVIEQYDRWTDAFTVCIFSFHNRLLTVHSTVVWVSETQQQHSPLDRQERHRTPHVHGSSHTHTYSGISQNTTTRWAWLIRKLKTESSPFLKWNHNFTRQNRQQPSEAARARKSSFLNVHSIRKRRPRNRDRVSEKK